MCSIAGFTSASLRDGSELARMMVRGAERGDYSAGVWTPKGYVRRLGAPRKLVRRRGYLRAFPARVALGHTRFPTQGGLAATDSQPFRCGDVVSTHNGHLFAPAAVSDALGLEWARGDVDSWVWPRAVREFGPSGVQLVADVEGYGSHAVAWRVGARVYLWRSLGACLVYAVGERCVMWASTAEMLLAGAPWARVRDVPAETVWRVDRDHGLLAVREIAVPNELRVSPAWDERDCGFDMSGAWCG